MLAMDNKTIPSLEHYDRLSAPERAFCCDGLRDWDGVLS